MDNGTQTGGIDALGNPTPAGLIQQQQTQPAQGLADQTPETEGTLPLTPPASTGASIYQQLSSKGSPFLRDMAKYTNQAAAANPQAAAAPGGWSRTLLAGAMNALGGGGLADAAAATEKLPPGAGWLAGATRTLAARKERLTKEKQQQFENQQEEQKNKMINAEANARMVHEQQLTHNLKEEGTQASLKSGLEQLEAWKSQANPGIERAKGLTADQAKEMLKKDALDPTEETLVPSGILTVTDKDGNPYSQLTYSVVKVTPVDLNPTDKDHPEQKQILDRINKYAPPEPGKTWQGENNGTVHFSGSQYNMLLTMANERQAADIAAQKVATQMGLAQEDVKKDEEAMKFRQDPNIIKALGQASTINGVPDFISARNALLQQSQNPKSPLFGQYNNIDNDMREYLGYTQTKSGEKNYLFDKMLDDYQKKIDMGMENITDLQKKVDTANGPKAAGLAGSLQEKINDPNTPAALKPRYQKMLGEANAAAKRTADYETDVKRREADAEQAANNGDLSQVMDMALNYQYDPDKLFSRFKGLAEKQKFLAEMHRQDPNWSESKYRARYNTTLEFAPEKPGGKAVQSLNTFAGHLGDANSLISSLQNSKSPLLNRQLNKIGEDVLGQPQFLTYRTAVQAAADNYIDFLLNMKAKHESDDEFVKKLTSTDISPATAQSMMRQMANTIAIKARQLNRTYRTTMEKDIPDLLDPDTQQIFKMYGIDPDQITKPGVSGLVKPTPNPNSQIPKGATHIYKDKTGNTVGYALNGKYVSLGAQ